jgi:hypothetical protein
VSLIYVDVHNYEDYRDYVNVAITFSMITLASFWELSFPYIELN